MNPMTTTHRMLHTLRIKIGAAVKAAGEDHVDLVVTDGGSGSKQAAAGAILEERYVSAKWQTRRYCHEARL